MRPTTPAVCALGCLLALSGCGGAGSSGDDEIVREARPPPEPQAINACLERAKVRTSPRVDRIAEDAGVGAVAAEFGKNRANIVVERNEADAERTEKDYERFTDNPEERVTREDRVVIAFDRTPVETETRVIEGCLGR